ncbi:gamma-glutamyltransferase, partial [Sphaerotilus sulfidivorans]
MILRRPAPALLAAATLLAACATPPAPPPDAGLPRQPEIATGQQAARPASRHAQFAVAAANPLATEAGRQMLARGGSALDAAIAVQMVLTLVEPQSSGIGGGAFLLHWDGQRLQAFDGRASAPAAAHGPLFLAPEGPAMALLGAVGR